MQNKTTAANAQTAEQRQQLEADYTFKRVVELELDPVRGNFDAAHLKEVNRRIFQDLPGAGFIPPLCRHRLAGLPAGVYAEL